MRRKKPGDESFENFQSNEQLKESKQPYVDSFDMKPFSSTFSLPSSQPSSQPPSQPSSQPSQPSSQPSQPSSQPLPSQLKYPLPKEMVSTAIRPRPRKSETDSISFENRTSESCKDFHSSSVLFSLRRLSSLLNNYIETISQSSSHFPPAPFSSQPSTSTSSHY